MTELRIDQIRPNPNQPRKDCDPEKLQELADSIKSIGLLNPILVRPNENDYEIVHGERRWLASRLAGLTEIRAEIRELTDEQAFLIALTENIQRDDLTPIEEARAFQFMVDDLGYSQAKVGETIGKSQQYVADRLVLLNLSEPIQSMITARAVNPSVGRMLARHDNIEEAEALAVEVAEGNLTVKGLERVLRGETSLPIDDDPCETIFYCRAMSEKITRAHDFEKLQREFEALTTAKPGEEWIPEFETEEERLDLFKKIIFYRNAFHLIANMHAEIWIREIRAGYQLYELLGEYLPSPHGGVREYVKEAQSLIRDKDGTGPHLWKRMRALANIPLGAVNDYFDQVVKKDGENNSDALIRFWSNEVWRRQRMNQLKALGQA